MHVQASELVVQFDEEMSESHKRPMYKITLGIKEGEQQSDRDVMRGVEMVLLVTLISSGLSALLHSYNALTQRSVRECQELQDRVTTLEAVQTMQREILGRVN